MDLDEFKALIGPVEIPAPVIHAPELGNGDRTLLYGYTVERHSWHVYLKDGLIHLLVTDHADKQIKHEYGYGWDLPELIPNKRAYPHATDALFARLCHERGVLIPFTTFSEERSHWTGFYKFTHDDL